MESQLFSISKIFSERILRIPDYQRGYAWKEKQLKDFWTDLTQLESGKNHYIGVLTLEEVPNSTREQWHEDYWIISSKNSRFSKNYEPYYVVDGQQRLTTIIILIQSITEWMDNNSVKKLNYTSFDEIRKKFIYDSKDDGISRSYIFGYEKDNPSYEFLKTKIFNEQSNNSFPIQETIYTYNLEIAKFFFMEKLKELKIDELETIYTKTTQHLLFNIYSISEDIDVHVAFETMNNRGKPLSHLELLKNRLIYLSTKFKEDEISKKQLRHNINEAWKSIYHYLGKNKNNPLDDDRFLSNHFLLYYGNRFIEKHGKEIPLRYIIHPKVEFFKDYLLETEFTTKNVLLPDNQDDADKSQLISVTDVQKYVQSLKDSVETWYQLLNPRDSEFDNEVKVWIEKLNRLDIFDYAPLLMIFFQKTTKNNLRVEMLKRLEQLIFFSSFMMRGLPYVYLNADTNIDFLDMSLKLSDGKTTPENIIDRIKNTFENLKKNPDILLGIIDGFRKKEKGFYKWNGIKYFLYEYELYLKNKTLSYREKINWTEYVEDRRDHHTIEHVYPQTPRRKECWTQLYNRKYTDKERTALRHSLGNLVPLSQPKNSSFQNKCFEEKKGGVDNYIGFSYGSYAENEIAQYQEWTAKEIMERGLKLLKFMEERWEINLGTIEQKLKLLNIEFVPKQENIQISSLSPSTNKPKKV